MLHNLAYYFSTIRSFVHPILSNVSLHSKYITSSRSRSRASIVHQQTRDALAVAGFLVLMVLSAFRSDGQKHSAL